MNERDGATSENWLEAPYNRWGFHHVGEMARTAPISRGAGPVLELPRKERCLDGFSFSHKGEEFSFQKMMDATYTDAMLVLQEGSVIFEYYMNGMDPSDTHLLMSASKSLTSTLCGVLHGRGLLKTEDAVTDHLAELRGTSWEGCTIQHLLDMRMGTRWDYDADEYIIMDVSDYRTHSRRDIPADIAAWIHSIGKSHEHGGPFRYCSLATNVLGWVLERAGGKCFADLFSEEIWSVLGAEFDAQIVLDHKGFPSVEGGICTTLRDFSRFGLMCLEDGRGGFQPERGQLVPKQWLDRVLVRDPELIATYANAPEYDSSKPDAFYHNKWWVSDAERGIYSAVGMNGQQLLIHRPSRTVVAKFSTQPGALDEELLSLQDAGLIALCESLV